MRCNNGKPTFQKALGFHDLLLFGVGAFILRCYNETNGIHVCFFLAFYDINKMFHIIFELILLCVVAFMSDLILLFPLIENC